jgi:hypothetical protein
MPSNSKLRISIDRLPAPLNVAVRAVFGPALDLPDGTKPWPMILTSLKQVHLFSPLHAIVLTFLGAALARRIPLSAACDPRIASLARIVWLTLYVILGMPLLTLAASFAVRRRFRDPYTSHSALVALVLLMTVFAAVAFSATKAFLAQPARVRTFAGEVLRCGYDGTPPPSMRRPPQL